MRSSCDCSGLGAEASKRTLNAVRRDTLDDGNLFQNNCAHICTRHANLIRMWKRGLTELTLNPFGMTIDSTKMTFDPV